MCNIGARIKQERERLELTQDAFASLGGVGKRALANYEKGDRSPDATFLSSLATAGVDVLYVLTGSHSLELNKCASAQDDSEAEQEEEEQSYSPFAKGKDPYVTIPRYDTGGAMGPGLVLREQPGVIDRMRVNRAWLTGNLPYYTSIRNLRIVTGFGDSMRGLFEPGDPLIIDTGINHCDVDGVYFFRLDDEGYIKTLQRTPGKIVVISENKKYKEWEITPDMVETGRFQVFAKVLRAYSGVNL